VNGLLSLPAFDCILLLNDTNKLNSQPNLAIAIAILQELQTRLLKVSELPMSRQQVADIVEEAIREIKLTDTSNDRPLE
jgi:hypothetical protein